MDEKYLRHLHEAGQSNPEATALMQAVALIRRARGKLNPQDCELGSLQRDAVDAEFLEDILRALADDAFE